MSESTLNRIYALESLEARVLLSGDPISATPLALAPANPIDDLPENSLVIQYELTQAAGAETAIEGHHDGIWEGVSDAPMDSAAPGRDEPEDTGAEVAACSCYEVLPPADEANDVPVGMAADASAVGVIPLANFNTAQQVEVLNAANAPPAQSSGLRSFAKAAAGSSGAEGPARDLGPTTLYGDIYTNGDNKLIDGGIVVGAGASVTISTGPLGGNIHIEGKVDGAPDGGGLPETLTLLAGTGDIVITGDVGSVEPLENLIIISAGKVTINGSIRVRNLFKIYNTSDLIHLGVPLTVGGPVGSVNAGVLDFASSASIVFEGDLITTSSGSPGSSLGLSTDPLSGNITVKGNTSVAGDLIIASVHDLRFIGALTATGKLAQTNGGGASRFDKAVTAADISLVNQEIVFNDRVSVNGAGNLVLTADEIDFLGGPATVSSTSNDASLLVLRPSSSVVPIRLGTAAGANAGVLDISNTDIAALTDKFLAVQIGWQASDLLVLPGLRGANSAVATGGSLISAAFVEIKSPGAGNDLVFTARVPGSSANGMIVEIFDNATMSAGAVEVRYYEATRKLRINVNLGTTTAAAVLAAVNDHTKIGDSAAEYTAANRPLTASAGTDYGATGLGVFDTVISARTAGGTDDVAATALVRLPGAANDMLFTALAAGADDNGATIILLNRNEAAIGVNYVAGSPGSQVLIITARLSAGSFGPAHTAAEIMDAVNLAADAHFRADLAAGDSGGTGTVTVGRATWVDPIRIYGASVQIIADLTAPAQIEMEAITGDIATPALASVITQSLIVRASNHITLNTSVGAIDARSSGLGHILISELDSISVARLATVSGSISLASAGGSITVESTGWGVSAQQGDVFLHAATAVMQNQTIAADGGDIAVQSTAGAVSMSAGVQTTSNGGSIRYASATTAQISVLNAGVGGGKISVKAGGDIADANGAAGNFIGSQLRLESGGGIGTGADPLETSVDALAAQAAGGMFLTETNSLQIDSVTVTVDYLNFSASSASITDVSLTGLTTTVEGVIVIVLQNGNLQINNPLQAGGAGNILLQAGGLGQDISIGAPISSGTGHISVLAGQDVSQTAAGDILSGGGTIDVAALSGSITMDNGALSQSTGGNIRYHAYLNAQLGGLDAGIGSASVTAVSGSILDGGDAHPEVAAVQVRLVAGLGVGAGSNHLEAAADTLAARGGAGGIFITDADGITAGNVSAISVNRVDLNGTAPVGLIQTDPSMAGLVTSGNGHIVLNSAAGSVTIDALVQADGAGNLRISALAAGQGLILQSAIQSGSGNLSLLAGMDINQKASGDISTAGGSIEAESMSGSILMEDGALTLSGGGAIRYKAANGVTVGGLDAGGGAVSIIATAGSIADGGDLDKDIQAGVVRLAAGNGIGNGAGHIDTAVNTIAATAGAGGIFLIEDDTLEVGSAAALTVSRVDLDGTLPPALWQTDSALQGEATTAGNGRVVQVTLNGSLTINQPVTADGTGNLLLQAGTSSGNDKDVTVNALVAANGGRITVLANRHVYQTAAGDITNSASTIDVKAENGAIVMDNGALARALGGVIRYEAAMGVALGSLNAGTGQVSVIANSGSITDNGDADSEIIAAKARVQAAAGIGTLGDALDSQIGILAGQAGGGGIFIANTGPLSVGSVGPVVSYRVKSTGTTVIVQDGLVNGIATSTGNGNIVLQTFSGNLSVDQSVVAHGSGNILLKAADATTDLLLAAPVLSASGNLSLLAGRDVLQGAASLVETGGVGTIDGEAGSGSFDMAGGAILRTAGGAVRLAAGLDVVAAEVNAGLGTVMIQAGRDVLENGDSSWDVAANSLRVTAGNGIGTGIGHLGLAVDVVAAQAGMGGIFLTDNDALTVGLVVAVQVRRVGDNGLSADYPAILPGPLAGLVTTTGDSPIIVRTLNGSLTINQAVAASGAGNILLTAQTTASNDKDLVAAAAIGSGSGNISLIANRHLDLSATADLATVGGTMDLESRFGGVTMGESGADITSLTTGGGNIRVKAAKGVLLGVLDGGTGDVSVSAADGSIADLGASLVDITADEVRLVASIGIGAGTNHLVITANLLAARAASGGIYVTSETDIAVDAIGQVPANRVAATGLSAVEQDAAALAGLATTAGNGNIVLVTLLGSLMARQTVSAQGTGNILLQASGFGPASRNLAAQAPISSGSGSISLLAKTDISLSAAGDLTTVGGTIDLEAGGGSLIMADGALVASNGGNIRLVAALNVELAGLSAGSGAISVKASAGAITDAGSAHKNLVASRARIEALTGVATGADPLETTLGTLAAHTASGGIFLLEDDAIVVDTVNAITVSRVATDGSLPVLNQQTDGGLSDLVVSSGAGSLVLRTTNGSITINDGTSPGDGNGLRVFAGNVLVQAQGSAADLTVAARISTASGSLSLIAGRNINQTAAGHVAASAGSLELEAVAGSISMADGATAQAVNGNLRYRAAQSISLGALSATAGHASVLAGAGSITDSGSGDIDVAAMTTRLQAATGIGAGPNHIETNTGTLAASTGSGLFVTNEGALIIDTVGPVIVNRVDADGGTPAGLAQTDAALSDLTTLNNNGAIVVRTVNGAITVNPGGAPNDGVGISAHGNGNIRIETQTAAANDKGITLNAAVKSTNGKISVLANGNLTLGVDGDVVTGGGTVDLESLFGSINMTNGALVQTLGAAIRLRAAASIALGGVDAGQGDVSIYAGSGSITDNGDDHKDIQAGKARLVAALGVGAAGNHLDTAIVTLAGRASSGGFFLSDDDALVIDALGVITVNRVDVDGGTPVVLRQTDGALTEVRTTSGNGTIVLYTLNGSLTVNQSVVAHGSGNIGLSAMTSDANNKDLILNSTVASGTGNISLLANANLRQTVVSLVSTAGGTVDALAANASIIMENGAQTQSGGGNIRYFAAGGVSVAALDAGAGLVSVSAQSGSISDAGDAHKDIQAGGLRLQAQLGIGSGLNQLDIAVATLSARAGSGGIFVVEDDNISVTTVGPVMVNRVAGDGTTPVILQQTDAALSDLVTLAGDGSIVLQTVNGAITLEDGAAPAEGTAVVANGNGHVLVEARDTTGANDKDIILNARVASSGGSVSIIANRHVRQDGAGDLITSGSGSIEVEARHGSVTMLNNRLAQTSGGSIRYRAAADVTLGYLLAGAGNVSVIASSGSILDGGDLQSNVVGVQLRLLAGLGIGVLGAAANALETEVEILSARAADGGVNILDADGLRIADTAVTVNRVTTSGSLSGLSDTAQSDVVTTAGNGGIVLRTLAGTLTLDDGAASADNLAVMAHGSGNILLAAGGATSDVLANSDVRSSQGHSSILAGRDVRLVAGVDVLSGLGGHIDLEAATGLISLDNLSLVSTGNGSIRLSAATDVILGGVNTAGDVVVLAATGSILDGGDHYLDIAANHLLMVAGTGVGTAANGLEITASELSARAGGGGINVAATDGVVVGPVSISVQRVGQNGLAAAQPADSSPGELSAISGDGAVILRAGGAIALNTASAVAASGSGNILVEATGLGADVVAAVDLVSGSGHITVIASRHVTFQPGADLRTSAGGSIDVEAAAGSVVMDDDGLFTTGTGDIRIEAALDVRVGGLSTGGNLSITAQTGSILDAGDTYIDLIGDRLRLWAGNGIGIIDTVNGVMTNALESAVNTVSARAFGGGVNLTEFTGLTVGDTLATVYKVQPDATVLAWTDSPQSDLVTLGGNGSIILRTANGTLLLQDGLALADGVAVRAHGVGNILLSANGAGASVHLAGEVVGDSGHITVLGSLDVLLDAGANIRTGDGGTIDVEALSGNIQMNDQSLAASGNGDIRVRAAVNAVIGGLSTQGNASITAVAGSILDAGDFHVDVIAGALRLEAGDGVGRLGAARDALETTVVVISARAGAGGINVAESNSLEIGNTLALVRKVQASGLLVNTSDATQSDLVTTGGNGSIVVETANGLLRLTDGAAPAGNIAVSAHGTGNILLSAGGAGADFSALADVQSGGGHVTILASGAVIFGSNADILTSGVGSIYIEAMGGGLEMADSSRFQSGSGHIRGMASGDMLLGGISTAGNISLHSETGSIKDAGATGDVDAAGSGLRLTAAVGIGTLGTLGKSVDVNVSVLAARAKGGGINILASGALTVDNVSTTIWRVNNTAGATEVVEDILSDVETTDGNGSIVLRTTAGNLTLNDGAAQANNRAIGAHGAGNILLSAGGTGADLTAFADISSGTGHVTVLAARDVIFKAAADIRTSGAGTIDVEAVAGNVTMADALYDDVLFSAEAGIFVFAQQSIRVGGIHSTTGNAALVAATGSVFDGGDTYMDVVANALQIQANVGVGEAARHLDTRVQTLAVVSGAGGVFIAEADALAVGTAGVVVQKVQATGLVANNQVADRSDVRTTAGNGSIVLRTLAGDLVLTDGANPANNQAVNANGAGNILLQVLGANTDVIAQADVVSGSGHITIIAPRDVKFENTADIRTGGLGEINVEASAGSVLMSDNSLFLANAGEIRVVALADVQVGGLETLGNLAITAANGSILDAGDAYRDVSGNRLRMVAGMGIGGFVATPGLPAADPALETNVLALGARAGGGGINVNNATFLLVDSAFVSVSVVQPDASLVTVPENALADLITTSGNGSIVVRAAAQITLNDGIAPDNNNLAVRAHGSGNILLQASGGASDIAANADVMSGSGHLTLLAGRGVSFAAGADARTGGGGTIAVEAVAGSVTMDDQSQFIAGLGDIRIKAAVDIRVGRLATSSNVSLVASSGSITDAADAVPHIFAIGLRMEAGAGIGTNGVSANPLGTNVTMVSARANGGGINLLEDDGLVVADVSATVFTVQPDNSLTALTDASQSDVLTLADNGSIVVRTTSGALTLQDGVSPSGNIAVSAHGVGNILLEAGGGAGDIFAGADILSGGGHVTLVGGKDIIFLSDADIRTGGTGNIVVESAGGAITMHDTSLFVGAAGNIRVRADGDVALGRVHTQGQVSLTSINGSIVDAGDAHVDVVADGLQAVAGNGIGPLSTSHGALETTAATFSGRATGGGINILETDGLVIGDVSVAAFKVQPDATVAAMPTEFSSDAVTIGGDGSIVIRTANGPLTLNDGAASADGVSVSAHGAGRVLLASGGSANGIAINADILSAGGHITVLAGSAVQFGPFADVVTGLSGTINLEAQNGGITMQDTSLLSAGSGDVRLHAVGDAVLGGIATAGNVGVTSLTGSILDAGDTFFEVAAAALRLDAGNGVGALGVAGNALETNVGVISARAAGGGINILEATDLVVDDVTVAILKVLPDGLTLLVVDAAQGDLVTVAGNGSVVVRTVAGSLTLNDGQASLNNLAVQAHGVGNVLVEAGGLSSRLEVNADLLSAGGHVTAIAGQHVLFQSGADIRTAASGTIDIEAAAGDIRLSADSVINTGSGDIRLQAGLDILLSGISTAGSVAATAVAGSVLDAGDNFTDITANGLKLVAGAGIGRLGAAANALEITVEVVSARAGSGGINLVESSGLVVGDTGASVRKVQPDGGTLQVDENVQSDLATVSGGGSIVLQVLAGDLFVLDGSAPLNNAGVSAHAAGNVLLAVGSMAGDMLVFDDITSGGGHITLWSGRDLALLFAADVRTSGLGSISVTAQTGFLMMDDQSLLATGSGDIRAAGAVDVFVGGLQTAGQASITAVEGSILDAGDAYLDIAATSARLIAGIGIGELGANANALEIQVATLAAQARGGGINLVEADGLAVGNASSTVSLVQPDGSAVVFSDPTLSDLTTVGGNGSVVLRSQAGSLTLNDGSAPANNAAVSVHGSGNVLLEAGGAGSLFVNADVMAGGGHVTMRAGTDLVLAGGADLLGAVAGTFDLRALGGSILMDDNSRLAAGAGNIRLVADQNLVVGGISTLGSVALTAVNGSILDGGDFYTDISANGLRLAAAQGIGVTGAGTNALETSVALLSARSSSGGIFIAEHDSVTIGGVAVAVQVVQSDASLVVETTGSQSDLVTTTGAAPIVIQALAGSLVLSDGDAPSDGRAVSAAGNILLAGLGATSDLVIGADVDSAGGSISLQAGRDINVAGNARVMAAGGGTLDFEAVSGSINMSAGALAQTDGASMALSAARNVAVGTLDARTPADRGAASNLAQDQWGRVAITATNGSIFESAPAADTQAHLMASALRLFAGNAIGGFDVREYRLQYTANFTTWVNMATIITADEQLTYVDAAPAGTMRFYRVIMPDDNARALYLMPVFQPDGTVKLSWNRSYNGGFPGLNALDVETGGLSAVAGLGGINVCEQSGLEIDAVGVGTNRVLPTGGLVALEFVPQSDLTVLSGGSLVLATLDGALTLRDGNGDGRAVMVAGNGNARLSAGGAAGQLVAHADILSGSGHVSLIADQSLVFAAGADVQSGAAGTLRIEAVLGSITMDNHSLFASGTGDISLHARNDITLGGVQTAGNVAVVAVTGMIRDGGDALLEVRAGGARFSAGSGVGQLGVGAADSLEIQVGTLSALAGAGEINLLATDAVVVGDVSLATKAVLADATLADAIMAPQSDLRTLGGNGGIVLQTLGGGITVEAGSGADTIAIAAHGQGNILVRAGGVGDQVILNGVVSTEGGNITVMAGEVTMGAGAGLRAGGAGTLDVLAQTGSVNMAANAFAETGGGNIRVEAAQNAVLGALDARVAADRLSGGLTGQASWGRVSVVAVSGGIYDADVTTAKAVNVFGESARLVAAIEVGSHGATPNALETELLSVAVNAGNGGFNLRDLTNLAVGTVGAVPASRVLSDGSVLVVSDSAALTGAIKTGGTAAILTDNLTPVTNYPGFQVLTTLSTSSPADSRTGLYTQMVRISNPTGSTIDAVRIFVGNLPAGSRLENMVGTENGLPYLQYNQALAPGQTVDLVVEYYAASPAVIPTAPFFLPTAVNPIPAFTPVGTVMTSVTVLRQTDNRYTVLFNALANRTYYIQYSNDGSNWTTVLSPIIGRGSVYTWLDNGPPKTNLDSSMVPVRYYRVILV